MASYTVNQQAVARARQLIDARQYVLKSVWDDVQPSAADENAYLESHSWEEYAQWHLALTDGASDNTKARYAFVYGDLRRLHRMGLIACLYRAAEWRHKEVELPLSCCTRCNSVPSHLGSARARSSGLSISPSPPSATRSLQRYARISGVRCGCAPRTAGGPGSAITSG
jgi:hypothetical protein